MQMKGLSVRVFDGENPGTYQFDGTSSHTVESAILVSFLKFLKLFCNFSYLCTYVVIFIVYSERGSQFQVSWV